MGGYNTVSEVLSTTTPALLVPRVRPRAEQLARARRLSELGLVDDVHPGSLTPALIGRWTDEAATRSRRPRAGIDLGGMDTVRRFAENHFEEVRRAA